MTLLPTFVLTLWLFTGQSNVEQVAGAHVLASGKDWTITVQDFETILGSLSEEARAYYSRPENRRAFLGDLIQMWVLAEEAQAKGVDSDPALKALITFYQKNLVAREYRQRFAEAATITDAGVEAFYKANTLDFTRVKASHILIMNSDSPRVQQQNFQSGVSRGEARKLIDEVKAKIEGGEDFAELAREYSRDPGSAENGGDLGFISRGQFVPEVEESAFKLDVGAYSDVIESPYGFHIVHVTERVVLPLDDVRNEIRQKMMIDQMNREVEARVGEAGVRVDEEYFKAN